MGRKIGLLTVFVLIITTLIIWNKGDGDVSRDVLDIKNRFENEIESRNFMPRPGIGQKVYHNLLYKFALLYPENLSVKEYSEGNTSTIIFEDRKRGEGFQIFIVPHSENKINQERFRMDAPSGIMNEPTEIYIDGVPATMFFSEDSALGEVREVWFIANGFLYEISTYKELDMWLSVIMKDWHFIKL